MQFPTNRVKQTSAVAEVSRVSNERELSFVETKGTDMPPEKFHPRPVNLSVNGKSDSMPFGKLMQKFVVEDEPEVDGKGMADHPGDRLVFGGMSRGAAGAGSSRSGPPTNPISYDVGAVSEKIRQSVRNLELVGVNVSRFSLEAIIRLISSIPLGT
ncbi:uncharacterized protein LOC18439779 isoform X1 [Amborella trichopoda]|uniref:uncharacterized protein LOC18439779 isoform X1 n=1 Tax=Amborella trichopoda TaxID=13333 RepID=UPI0009BC9202|nr:uncharacterized protein LOC18439779 isoform X1 [Amborella trichopoda]XP_020526261.1 uncharacterized protein LOC18439779 isoform X1 [Amborella trichopoda]XP_020526262.1 uncharacterized protein LOC18439779 isoform X1 [Amborella trichopoda]XP_020526263.1 uncharacterized protein LOC18439779 isoform X1 [Amborella trichopoda]|eukprot:XP_020526259.1 uncharacterized protein LOC18439779 isoform X1 [Amborella trichopoda]